MSDPAPFPDHFSSTASEYARFRPGYPEALFAWLAGQRPPIDLVFDCATGSGQAAIALAEHGFRVVAGDASIAQLAHAAQHPRVSYLAATAERIPLRSRSIGLVTIAQALHWFNAEAFFGEVRRILVAGGIVAAWSYGDLVLDSPLAESLAPVLERLRGYWPPERERILDGYRSVPFPFRELETPAWQMEQRWTLEQLLGYAATWSATQLRQDAGASDIIAEMRDALAPHWPAGARRLVRWPLTMRAGVLD